MLTEFGIHYRLESCGIYELSYLILIDSGLNDFSVPTKPKFPELMLEYVNEDAREWITNLVDVI